MDDADGKFPSQLADRFQVRMPDGLRDRIALAAQRSGRSMNAEIVATLESQYPPTPSLEELLSEIDVFLDIALEEHSRAALFRVRQKMVALKELRTAGEFGTFKTPKS